jgi:hypothetical protein
VPSDETTDDVPDEPIDDDGDGDSTELQGALVAPSDDDSDVETGDDEAGESDEEDESDGDDESDTGFGDLDPDGIVGEVAAHGERVDDGLTYDCTAWSGESRTLLDAMLGSAGIVHSWQGTVLGVPPEDEDRVDAIIEEVLAAATVALDPARDKVAYEVGTWSASIQSTLAEALAVADIPYEWDVNGDLVIYTDDEERAEEIFEGLPDPEDPELSSDDGVAVQDLLSRLFVAAGHLAKKPTDADSVVDVAETTDQLERLSLPFGFEPAVWKNLVGLASNLRDALAEDDEDLQLSDDELKEKAAAVRITVRQYV